MRALLIACALLAGCRAEEICEEHDCSDVPVTPGQPSFPSRKYLSCIAETRCSFVYNDTTYECEDCDHCAAAIGQVCRPPEDLGMRDLVPPPDLAEFPDYGFFTGAVPKIHRDLSIADFNGDMIVDFAIPRPLEWNDESDCPPEDRAGEPNDSRATATRVGDLLSTVTFSRRAICPRGIKVSTGAHDVDVFRVRIPDGKLGLRVTLDYEFLYGDLDLALLDENGVIVALDGSARSDACASRAVPPGTYYAVVVGAGDVDVNEYAITFEPQPRACP